MMVVMMSQDEYDDNGYGDDDDDHTDPARGLNDWLSVDTQEGVQIPKQFKITKRTLT